MELCPTFINFIIIISIYLFLSSGFGAFVVFIDRKSTIIYVKHSFLVFFFQLAKVIIRLLERKFARPAL